MSILQPNLSRDEPERKLVPSMTVVCRRCKNPIKMDEGYIAGKSYGFSHCGLVQIAKAPSH